MSKRLTAQDCVRRLRDEGFRYREIVQYSGLSSTTLCKILKGSQAREETRARLVDALARALADRRASDRRETRKIESAEKGEAVA